MNTDTTRTMFRKFPDEDIVALFPDILASHGGLILDYMHIGQHGQADYEHVMSITVPALPDEFKPLLDELTNLVGYHCFIINKREDTL